MNCHMCRNTTPASPFPSKPKQWVMLIGLEVGEDVLSPSCVLNWKSTVPTADSQCARVLKRRTEREETGDLSEEP
jgi:hypothetical protein